MTKKLMTPGVYIEEVNAFPSSVIEVETAIPAFIGYTQKASRNGKSLSNTPTRVTSLKEYIELFGKGNKPNFKLTVATDKTKHKMTIVKQEGPTVWALDYSSKNELYFYNSIRLFYANGGSTCYIVSVGTFSDETNEVNIEKDRILEGLETLTKEQEPTIIVIPDAVYLEDDCYEVYKQVLAHCAKMQSRVAILDIFNGDTARERGNAPEDIITNFREKIGTENLDYAAAYYPWLSTNVVRDGEVTFENFNNDGLENLKKLLPEWDSVKGLLGKFPIVNMAMDKADRLKRKDVFLVSLIMEKPNELGQTLINDRKKNIVKPEEPGDAAKPAEMAKYKTDLAAYEVKVFTKPELPEVPSEVETPEYKKQLDQYKKDIDKLENDLSKAVHALNLKVIEDNELQGVKFLLDGYINNKIKTLHLGLIAMSPTYVNILNELRTVINLLPPSSAMAGIYTAVDDNRGVWKAPANVSVNSVIKPAVNITHDEQENLNVDAISGKSINAIRTFPGIGTLVWGARTLDGNSLDWKYINVRRTIIMLEQSIKLALRDYVFEPNDANTWVLVKSMIVNFLTEKWKQGALAGASPEDAFDVQIGLGSTMTNVDILEGKMLMSIKLAIVRPAEFIVVTFQQQMQKS